MTTQGDDKKLTIRRRGGFTVIPNSVAQDERLSLQARGFLAYLLSLPDGWVHRVSHLTKKCGIGRDKCYALVKELKALGYLSVERVRDTSGQFIGANWHIEATPHHPTENPDTAQPDPGESAQLENNHSLQSTQSIPAEPDQPDSDRSEAQLKSCFEEFWRSYPRPKDRRRSLSLFLDAVNRHGISPEFLTTAARKHAEKMKRSGTKRHFISNSVNWLDTRGWEDYKKYDTATPDLRSTAEHWAKHFREGRYIHPASISVQVLDAMLARNLITDEEFRQLGSASRGCSVKGPRKE